MRPATDGNDLSWCGPHRPEGVHGFRKWLARGVRGDSHGRMLRIACFAALTLAALPGCAIHRTAQRPASPLPRTHALWLVSNGFHSAVALSGRDAGPELRAMTADANPDWLLVGWGNADFFTSSVVSPGLFLRAAFLPGPSALHVVPVRGPMRARFPNSDLLVFTASAAEIAAARHFIAQSLGRDTDDAPIPIGRGYFPGSRFWKGRETFCFVKTCNVWTARLLASAGIPASRAGAYAASELVWHVTPHGRRHGWLRRPVDAF
jgi:Protein of unknown function (DUF2459)